MKNNKFEIETIKMPNSNEVSFCGERGGIITSLIIKNKEILYLDRETFDNKDINVRGGIPILFPNAGAIVNNYIYPNLKQHGFARDLKWKIEKNKDSFKELLIQDRNIINIYPYNFNLFIYGKFEKNGSFTIKQEVQSMEEHREVPVSMGLHPYFNIKNEEKGKLKFNFDGGMYIEEHLDDWANGNYISIDNPKINDINAKMEIIVPSFGALVVDASVEYRKIWIWSLPGKDFICIEPVMRDVNGLINNPEKIKPLKKITATVNFNIN